MIEIRRIYAHTVTKRNPAFVREAAGLPERIDAHVQRRKTLDKRSSGGETCSEWTQPVGERTQPGSETCIK